MASSSRKRGRREEEEEEERNMQHSSGDDSSDAEDSNGGSDSEGGMESLNVEFEFFDPAEKDFHGLKLLFSQLWEKNSVDLSSLADLVIRLGSLGSCIKVDGNDDPYAVLALINLAEHKNEQCVKQIVGYLLDRVPKSERAKYDALLNDASKPVGLIVNERLINMPPQTAVPMFKMMLEEVSRRAPSPPLSHYLIVMKTYREGSAPDSKDRKAGGPPTESELFFYNDEEDIIKAHAQVLLPFKLKTSQNKWTVTNVQIKPERILALIPAEKLSQAISEVEEAYKE